MANEAYSVVIEDDTGEAHVDPATGDINVPQGDGGVVVHLNAAKPAKDDEDEENPFNANLINKIDGTKLGALANDLHQAISADDQSREGNLENYTKALSLLGTKLEDPRPSVGDSSAAADGLSVVTNPLLLEILLKSWANAAAELLPASGPVKISEQGDETSERDELAEAYERDFNYYLTKTATEFYPDTSQMLLWNTHLRGSGFKKVYRCPLRRRPVSESVDAKDLIVSNTMKDLRSCSRITHQILMPPSVMARMQHAGAYRKIVLPQPSQTPSGPDEKIAGIQGTQARPTRPEDQPYTIWESQCELELDAFAPRDFKDTGIPLPYIVTLDKESRDVLAIRRDWNEEDKECKRRRMYVRYPYVPGPGFYGTGLLNILGNCSAAATAGWRIALDRGMLANFPGGLISEDATRQNSNIQKVGPTEFAPVKTGGKDIRAVVMGLPYTDVTPGILTLLDKIEARAQAVGGAAEIPAGEGLANVPVGTMLAQIEQATKVMAEVHKGEHQALSEEIELFAELFREHPEDFWRGNRDCPPDYWDVDKLQRAMTDCRLVPVSDPNVPSHIHRVAKAVALVQLFQVPVFAQRLSVDEALSRVLRAMREDPRGLILPPPPPQSAPPDPKMIEASAKVITAQSNAALASAKAQQLPQQTEVENEKLATQREVAAADIAKEHIIHDGDMVKAQHQATIDRGDQAIRAAEVGHKATVEQGKQSLEAVRTAHDISQDHHDRRMDVADHNLNVYEAKKPEPKPAKPKGKK
jgi:hypothetical protein